MQMQSMQIKDNQVFLVSGYTGQQPSADTLFSGTIVAVDHDDAKASMRELMGDLTITGATSLEELKTLVASLEKVKSFEMAAPISEARNAMSS